MKFLSPALGTELCPLKLLIHLHIKCKDHEQVIHPVPLAEWGQSTKQSDLHISAGLLKLPRCLQCPSSPLWNIWLHLVCVQNHLAHSPGYSSHRCLSALSVLAILLNWLMKIFSHPLSWLWTSVSNFLALQLECLIDISNLAVIISVIIVAHLNMLKSTQYSVQSNLRTSTYFIPPQSCLSPRLLHLSKWHLSIEFFKAMTKSAFTPFLFTALGRYVGALYVSPLHPCPPDYWKHLWF